MASQASRTKPNLAASLPHIPGIELLSPLGSGAHGTTYRARHAGGICAVKLEPWVPESQREQRIRHVRREAALLAGLDHPGLPKVYAAGECEGHPYIVMELVEGEQLSAAISRGRWTELRVVSVARALADALAEVHRHGLVHRDIKPANVLLDVRGDPRLIDFGLAARIAERDRTGDAPVVGSLAYMAPEQSGAIERGVDGRADLYALGAVIFECATGSAPFVSADAGELIRMHATLTPANVRQLRADFSPVLGAIVAKLLAKDPDDRYTCAQALSADLSRLEARLARQLEPEMFALDESGPLVPGFDAAALCGRDAELEQLQQCHVEARRGYGALAIIVGPAGQGKSHLVQAFVQSATGGLGLMRAKCDQGESVPLGPFRRALGAYLAQARSAGDESRLRRVLEGHAAALVQLCPAIAERFGLGKSGRAFGRDEELLDGVVGLLLELSREAQPLVVCLDDLQWIDGASLRVLQRLVTDAVSVPLLFVATARDGEPERAVVQKLIEQAGTMALALELGPLSIDNTRQILTRMLGKASLTDALVARLHLRSAGSPFSLRQYVRALLDAGALVPHWGSWQLDEQGLERLPLPDDVLDLVLARVGELGPDARRVLQCAAVLGQAVDAEILRRVLPTLPVDSCLREALRGELLSSAEHGYSFVHDRVREAMLKDLDEEAQTNLHDRVAEVLEQRPEPDLFALARHHARGHWELRPARVLDSNYRAAKTAMSSFAFEEAHRFFGVADQVSQRFELALPGDFDELASEAALRAGWVENTIERLERAVARTSDPLKRVKLHVRLATLHRTNLDIPGMRKQLSEGYRILGLMEPRDGIFGIVLALVLWVWFVFVDKLRLGYGSAKGEAVARLRARLALYAQTVELGALDNSPAVAAEPIIYGLWPAQRLGDGAEYVEFTSRYAAMLLVAGLKNASEFQRNRAVRIAAAAKDPVAIAGVALFQAYSWYIAKAPARGCEMLAEVMEQHGRWLALNDYLTVCEILAASRTLEGRAQEALQWIDRAQRRAAPTRAVTRATRIHRQLDFYPAASLAQLGRTHEALRAHRVARGVVEAGAVPWTHQNIFVCQTMIYLLEQEELGDELDTLIDSYTKLGVGPGQIIAIFDRFWVLLAHARLLQLRAAMSEAERARRMRQLDEAMVLLGKAVKWGLVTAHREVLRGAYFAERGQLERAQKYLERGATLARRDSNQWALFEATLWQARVAQKQGRSEALPGLLETCSLLCEGQGWRPRAQRLRREFPAAPVPSSGSQGSSDSSILEHDARSLRRRRQLEALLHQGIDAANLLDAERHARRILDDLVRVFDAEHALLFLLPAPGAEPVLAAGRDGAGNDILGTSAFSRKLVDQVVSSRKPTVLTTDAEKSELSAQESIVAHGLRSVMAAPLVLGDRVVGAVHLDSRLARGIFTHGDAEVLAAMTQHLAVGQEMARSARVEIERQALEKDLQLTAAVQALLLPERASDSHGPLSLAAHYQPASQAGGDFWTYHWLPDGGLRVMLGDVTGHGVSAAMVTAAVSGCYRALSRDPSLATGTLLGQLHEALQQMCGGRFEMAATALDVRPDGSVTAYSAGAPPAMVVRGATGDVEMFGAPGRPLGSHELVIGVSRLDCAPGDRLVVYSDGVSELVLPGGRIFGLRRLKNALARRSGSPSAVRAELCRELEARRADATLEDDITFVVVGLDGPHMRS